MTLDDLSRYHWAREWQAYYMGAAIRQYRLGDEQTVWYCLFQWIYHMDIADQISVDMSFVDWSEVNNQSRGYFE